MSVLLTRIDPDGNQIHRYNQASTSGNITDREGLCEQCVEGSGFGVWQELSRLR
jgi:hypothetical protein